MLTWLLLIVLHAMPHADLAPPKPKPPIIPAETHTDCEGYYDTIWQTSFKRCRQLV